MSEWLLILIAASFPVVVPYPYSTKEACVAAMEEAAAGQAEPKYICIRVEPSPQPQAP